MEILEPGDLRPGMIVADDIKNFDGRVILKKGSQLAAEHIRAVKAWGITRIKVMRGPLLEEMEPAPAAARRAPVKIKVPEIFRRANHEHPAIKELIRLHTLYRQNGGN